MHGTDEDKPFKCGSCKKGFADSYKLKQHTQNVHSEDRPFKYKLDGCKYASKTLGNLKVHESSLHIQNRKYAWVKDDANDNDSDIKPF